MHLPTNVSPGVARFQETVASAPAFRQCNLAFGPEVRTCKSLRYWTNPTVGVGSLAGDSLMEPNCDS
jgi:hypothetical protein